MARQTLAACMTVAACAVAMPAAQQLTFRAGIDLVTFGVTAVDEDGGLVTDLTRDDFMILEDGVPQTLQYFAQGDDADQRAKKRLGLMLDTSGSMEQDLDLARSAAIKFLNLLPEAEDITLVDFDTEVRITRYPQRDFVRLVERIRMREPEGWTALYDALGVYLDGAQMQDGRKILVMYTDGGDTRSTINLGDLLTLLQASQVTVYAVGLTRHTGSHEQGLRMTLQQIVEATGGRAFFPSKIDDLDSAYAGVLEEIKTRYHLGYASTNTTLDGSWREVEIVVTRPGVKVRTREGYFAPYRDDP